MVDVIAVVTDLFFQSRISAAARAAGNTLRFLTSDAAVAAAPAARLTLIDLDAQLDVLAAIRTLSARGDAVLAFGPHLDTDARKAARAAGAGRVLAKSKFVTELPHLMAALHEESEAARAGA
ncbi:MAG: hypothetical protein ACRDFX_09395 [Chloroflexota bacterium]